MHTVLNSRMMDAVMALRRQGQHRFACEALVDGKRQPALLGPRIDGCPNDVRVKIGDTMRVLPLGQISVGADVLPQIQAMLAELDAAQKQREMTETDLINRLLWQRNQSRRRPSGQYAGHHCEPAGRR